MLSQLDQIGREMGGVYVFVILSLSSILSAIGVHVEYIPLSPFIKVSPSVFMLPTDVSDGVPIIVQLEVAPIVPEKAHFSTTLTLSSDREDDLKMISFLCDNISEINCRTIDIELKHDHMNTIHLVVNAIQGTVIRNHSLQLVLSLIDPTNHLDVPELNIIIVDTRSKV